MPWLGLDPLRIDSRRLPAGADGQPRRSWATGRVDPAPLPKLGELVGKFGQDFAWSTLHWLPSELEPWRRRGDEDVDALLHKLQPGPAVDVVKLACEAASAAPPAGGEKSKDTEKRAALAAWHARMSDVPEWVDWDQLQRGQEVFIVFAPSAALSLYYLSLIGGFSAPLITRVLRATAYLTAPPKQVMRRLVDTGAMISACVNGGSDALRAWRCTMAQYFRAFLYAILASIQLTSAPRRCVSLACVQARPERLLMSGLLLLRCRRAGPGGAGWVAALQVRVLHAKVRQRLRGRKYWNQEEWGVPINQVQRESNAHGKHVKTY